MEKMMTNRSNIRFPDMSSQDEDSVSKGKIALSAAEIASATGGTWEQLDNPEARFTSVGFVKDMVPGQLCITRNTAHWGEDVLDNTEASIEMAGEKGAAVVVDRKAVIEGSAPRLRVENTRDALRQIAIANRDKTSALRILVTGAGGKTGFKIMLHHVLEKFMNCHAVRDSRNMIVPIWCSLSSIRSDDAVEITEAAVGGPKRGRQCSEAIKPHICVITNIDYHHTHYHGSLANLVKNKAEAACALQPGGVCIANADNPYFFDLKSEIQHASAVPVMSFGSHAWCDGQLVGAIFDNRRLGWKIYARVFGKSVNYFLPMINGYAPLASVSVLLAAAYIGVEPQAAATALSDFVAYKTTGQLVSLPIDDGNFFVFDYSLRGSLGGFKSNLDDVYRLATNRRILAVIGSVLGLSEADNVLTHESIARMIDPGRITRVFTVGEEMKITRNLLEQIAPEVVGPHGDKPSGIRKQLFGEIQPGDVVFVMGHHRVWLSHLVADMKDHFGKPEKITAGELYKKQDNSKLANSGKTPGKLRSLVAGGDVMLARRLPDIVAKYGQATILQDLKPLLSGADVALVNLECVVSTRGEPIEKNQKRPSHYNCDSDMLDILTDGGVDVVTTANNHAMDFGPEAIIDQIKNLDSAGLAQAGSGANLNDAMQPAYVQAGDLVVAIVAFETETPFTAAVGDKAGVFHIPIDFHAENTLAPIMNEARLQADLVIVSPHWGGVWKEVPDDSVRRLAWALIDMGADAVLGHSARILQGIEVYKDRPIVYGMGSLVFDRIGKGRMDQSALFQLQFDATGVKQLTVHPAVLTSKGTRLATQEEARAQLDLIVELSSGLCSGLDWARVDNTLQLELVPSYGESVSRSPRQIHQSAPVHPEMT